MPGWGYRLHGSSNRNVFLVVVLLTMERSSLFILALCETMVYDNNTVYFIFFLDNTAFYLKELSPF